MKRNIFCIVSVMLVICFLFSSCKSSDLIKPVDSLLSPPLYHEEYESLVNAFYEKVSKNVVFCSPQKGDYRSAIIVEDIDDDGEKEALIFYRDEIESSVAKLHYFNIVEGNWVSRADFIGYGNEVEKIMISDMDGDGNSELIVIWRVSGVSSSSIMSVYRTSYNFDTYKEISNEMCTVCELTDINGDSKEEIFYMNQTTSSGIMQRYARVMGVSGDTVVLMGEAKVDPNISSYTSVKTEKASEDSPFKIYVDALKGETQMITELIYWDSAKSELCAPFLDAETMSNIATLRYEPIPSTDINNDGVIDIPVQNKILGGEETVENFYITEWIDYSGDEPETVANTVINYEDKYMIGLGTDEVGAMGVRSYRSQNCWIVYSTASADGTAEELYTVLKIPSERWDENEFGAYISVIEYEDSVICVYITQNGTESGIDEEYIKSRITKIPT